MSPLTNDFMRDESCSLLRKYMYACKMVMPYTLYAMEYQTSTC